jgi:hypothetical protein
MKRSTILRTSTIGALCALAGGAAGIAGSTASSSGTDKVPISPERHRLHLFGAGGLAGAAGPPVHADAVVPNQSGGFDTVTMDRGRFSSLSGDQLTIAEGTKTATYKTVTLTIPQGARIRRNGARSQLTDLKGGDEITVLQSSKATAVIAHDAQHQLSFRLGLLGRGGVRPLPPAGSQGPDEGPPSGG